MPKFVINESFLEQVELLRLALKDNVAGLFGGNHKSKAYGSSCEFADYRSYLPGDDISKIDWNVFARFNQLFVKLFLDERQMHTKIYIDASESMSFDDKDKQALLLASTLAYLSIKETDKVSIYYVQNKQVYEVVSSIVCLDSYLNSIYKLNDIEFKGESFLSEGIIPSNVGYGDGKSIVISDFLTDHNYFDMVNYLRSKKRDVLLIQVLSNEELDPIKKGKMIYYDAENKSSFYKKNIDKDVLNAYHQALNYVIERNRDLCLSVEANYLLVNSKESLTDIFMKKMIEQEVVK